MPKNHRTSRHKSGTSTRTRTGTGHPPPSPRAPAIPVPSTINTNTVNATSTRTSTSTSTSSSVQEPTPHYRSKKQSMSRITRRISPPTATSTRPSRAADRWYREHTIVSHVTAETRVRDIINTLSSTRTDAHIRYFAPGFRSRIRTWTMTNTETDITSFEDTDHMCQDDGAPTLAHPPRPPAVSLPQSLELIRLSASDRTTSDPAPEPPDATLAPQPAIPSDAIAQPVTLTTLNTRGMHTSLVDLLHTMERTQPDILSLTETKHSHIKSI